MCLWRFIINGLICLINSKKNQMSKKFLRNHIYADKLQSFFYPYLSLQTAVWLLSEDILFTVA